MSQICKKAIEGLDMGDTFSASRTFIEQDVSRFADISRDYNPVHWDEQFAKVKILMASFFMVFSLLLYLVRSEDKSEGWLLE